MKACVMQPIVFLIGVILALAITRPAGAQTLEELRKENLGLKLRIQALETALKKAEEHKHDHSHEGHKHDHKHDHQHEGQCPNGHEHNGHDHEHGQDFDYFRPYQSHRHGCLECFGNGLARNQVNHSHGGGHGNRHANGDARHESIEGYPFVHGIRTEIDFIERALELDLVRTRDANGVSLDAWQFEAELVWAINNRMAFIIGVPLIALDPEEERNTSGIGDLEIGFRFQAFNGERLLLFFGLDIEAPTGDEDRGVGEGNTFLTPLALALVDFGGGTYLQSVFGIEVPIDTDEVENVFRYDLGLYHTFVSTESWRFFRYFTPAFEVNGLTALNGPKSGLTVVDLTLGFRWVLREFDEAGFGWSFPVTGRENFDHQLIFSYRIHF